MPTPTRIAPRRSVCALLLLSQLAACYEYAPMRRPLEQQVGDEHIGKAWLTFRNGPEASLRDVTVRADSVIGYVDDWHERRAIPFADVMRIERQQVSIARTGALVISLAVSSALVAVFANSRGEKVMPTASPAASAR